MRKDDNIDENVNDDKEDKLTDDDTDQDQDSDSDDNTDQDSDSSNDDSDNSESLLKKNTTLLNQKKVYREKYEKEKAERLKLQKQLEERSSSKKRDTFSIDRGERAEFRQDHTELTREDVDEIQSFAESKGISLEEAISKPIVKSFIEDRKKDRSGADNVPNSSRTPGRASKDIDYLDPGLDFKKVRQQAESNYRKSRETR
jgi:hypothetical protein